MALNIGDTYPGTNERIMGMIPGSTPGTFVYVGELGGVFADNQQDFAGSYFSLDEQHRNDPNRRFSGIEATDGGGYRILSDRPGEQGYAFQRPQQPAPVVPQRSLYEDPAWLAFMASSGLGIESMAADVASQENAVNTALATRVAGLGLGRDQNLRGVDSNYESRGLYGSTGRLNRRADEETNYANQLGSAQNEAATQIGGLKSRLTNTVAEQQARGAGLAGQLGGDMYTGDLSNVLGGLQTTADTKYQESKNKYISLGGK